MAHKLIACVSIPHVRAHVARQQLALPPARPLVVATHVADRALVVDVCPEARRLGLRAGMFAGDAQRGCPAVVIAVVEVGHLSQVLEQVETVLQAQADVVERHTLGTWTLPLVALGEGFAHAPREAQLLCRTITDATALPGVIGLGASATIARIAADVAAQRPDGVVVVLPGAEPAFLAPLPVRLLPGVGERGAAALQRLGVTTAGQLAQLPVEVLQTVCGPQGPALGRLARGHDPGASSRPSQTIRSTWRAEREPCAEAQRLAAQLYLLVEAVGRALRARAVAAGCLTVRVGWADGSSAHHRTHFTPRCDLDRPLVEGARVGLGRLLEDRRLTVVELTVIASDLGPRQQDLFATDDGPARKLQQAVDALKRRFGPAAILPGALLNLSPSLSGIGSSR